MTKVFNSIKPSLVFIALAVVIIAGFEAIVYIPFYGASKAGFTANPTDFITIILAAVAVILTVLAIILAVAGVVGYAQIKEVTVKTAKSAAEKTATDRLDELLPRQVLRAVKQSVAIPSEMDSDQIARSQSESDE